jgi:hypothetical protein
MWCRRPLALAALSLCAALLAAQADGGAGDSDAAGAAPGILEPGNEGDEKAASDVLAEEGISEEGPGPITWNPEPWDMRPTDFFISDTVQVIINADAERFLESGPSPILNMLGVGLVLPLPGALSIAPRLDFYSAYYDWVDGRAMPIDTEFRLASVLGAILDLPLRYQLTFGRDHFLHFSAGPAFLLRVAFRTPVAAPEEQPEVDALGAYLWSGGRFFYPGLGVSYSYRMADWVSFGVSARVLLPVFNWWTGEGLPFADNLIAGGGIWISFTDFWRKPPK